MHIRKAISLDGEAISEVHLSAFSEEEREIVCKLAIALLSENTTPPTISLVAEAESDVIGHVAFSPVAIDDSKSLQGYILAPLGVKPNYQNRGIGSKLINTGIQQLSKMGVNMLFVYGDPKYYGRFGFSADIAKLYIPPYKLQYTYGWQAIALNESKTVSSPVKITCVPSLCNSELW